MTKVLSILLVTWKMKLLDHYVFFYLKWNIKYYENGSKNMSFLIKNDEAWDIYDIYLKTKVREFDGVIKTNFSGKGVPKENMY